MCKYIRESAKLRYLLFHVRFKLHSKTTFFTYIYINIYTYIYMIFFLVLTEELTL